MKRKTPATSDDRPYWVAFNRVPGLGAVRYTALLARFGSLDSAWSAGLTDLKASGIGESAARAIQKARGEIDPEGEMERLETLSVRALTWNDDEYPELLKSIDDAPPVLYVRGEITPQDGLGVAVVGTRRPTPYGRQAAEEMAHGLASNRVTVVSGLARGVDGVAHRAALSAGGRTLAVMACGLDMVYPAEHARLATEIIENGAVMSEQPLGTQPRGDFFPRRNRILSGLSLGTLVIEGDQKSGALITADFANDQGRDVFAVPGSIFSPQSRGPNLKVQRGEAKLVLKVADILEELNLQAVPQQLQMRELIPATDTEAEVLRHLTAEPVHIDDICRSTGMPVATVSSLLAMMELKGLVQETGGKAYVRTRHTAAA
jgi:DNA processing protein